MTGLVRSVIAMMAAGLLLLASTAVASAHATRISTDPADKASVGSGPTRVSATFNEQLQPTFAAMTVVGPDGNLWSTGEPEVSGAVLSVAVRPLGPVGTYTVNYRVTSADGHPVSGSWSFELTTPGTGTPGPAAGGPSDDGGGLPVWPFVAGAAVLVAAGAVLAVRRRT